MLIYLVEDDQSILELEEYALQAQGFETQGFGEGESFLPHAASACRIW